MSDYTLWTKPVSEWTRLPEPSSLTPEQVVEIREAVKRAAPVSDDRIAAAFARQPGDYP